MALIIEDNIMTGGIGEKVSATINENGLDIKIKKISISDQYFFIYNKNRELVEKDCGLDLNTLKDHVKELITL